MITLSFVIPVFNEENRIKHALHELKQASFTRDFVLEKVIFVNDGSTDKTITLIRKQKIAIEKRLNAQVEIISYKKNRGKGYAVRQGMLASTADYTLFFDADMSTPLSEIKKFIPWMKKGINTIIGTRKNGKATVIKYQPLYRQLLGKGFTAITNIILQAKTTDYTCGFKAFSKQTKNHIFSIASINRWGYDAEIIFLSGKFGYIIQEVPILWSNNDESKVSILKDVVYSLYELLSIHVINVLRKYENKPRLATTGIFATK